MIKPNWDIFKAKFSENPQNNFEWFCYLLFCKEFNKEFGVFRYINQAALETEPIKVEEEVIGWQAKFYDVSLSERKEAILTTLEKSKQYYSNITKLIFYTNQEWGQTKGEKPKGLLDVEKKAKELNITIDWRTASFFESEFVANDNEFISKYFFTLEKSIVDLLEEQRKHTQNILNEIHTNIIFNENNIEINRENCIEELKKQYQKVFILSGVGGVGKTVVIKKLYEYFQEEIPFFVFKATEFELRHINDLFTGFTFYDFSEAIKEEQNKVIVIDSAEKLLDLKNTDPFKEFLSILIKENWQIIFTTRTHYLENLYTDLSEIYNITPVNINIDVLIIEELEELSEKYTFNLPKDEKLLTLIKNPFYLSKYLKFYNDTNKLNYVDFKTELWNKFIKKSQPERERCFFKIAFERANSGQFFISPDCESTILHDLVKDGILGYEKTGYFITHDIYEEWALEETIEIEFIIRINELDFFEKIGHSLAIRRSFRNWLSEKLLLEDENIKTFIEEIISHKEISQFWKDELLVSILLSNYSKVFFELFKDELLENEQSLLKRITFILRMTCKDIDNDFFIQLGIKKLNIFSLKYVLTKPKGDGWQELIKFVFDNISRIGLKNINFILPIIHDWNNNIRNGETTRFSSLIALQFYEWIIKEDVYWSRHDSENELFKTIINGSSEVKDELSDIFNKVLKNKWKQHDDPYSGLVEFILTKFEAQPVLNTLPEYILKLSDLFWTYTPNEDEMFPRSSIDIEQYFGLEQSHSNYHPSSAYQTPIFWLLKTNFKETVDFILNFTNKSIEEYATSGFDSYVKKVNVYIDKNLKQEQYLSHCLWNMYRGTGSPVSPYLLQSIHMALEKYFLEVAKSTKTDILEDWLLYLLKNSVSSSISSVVASIVLAYPDKTFNVAKVLFKTKEFIQEDTVRLVAEESAESLYSIAKSWGVTTNRFHDEERIKTCKDKHRKISLENLFLQYQFFRNEGITEEESEIRQKELWSILDFYYDELSTVNKEDEDKKTWRLYLSRMDRRKMNPTLEKTDEGVIINFNPELESSLKEYSESSIAKSVESMKYTSLKIWSDYKFKQNEKAKEYEKYESNPKLAVQEVREIIEEIETAKHIKGENFYSLNRSIPAYVCSVLLRDYYDELSEDEQNYCKDIVLSVAVFSLTPKYQYQISDGVQEVFSILHLLLNKFPQESEKIQTILFITLFKNEHVGGMLDNESFNVFSIIEINKLWENHFNIAESILFGYILLKPKYDELIEKIRQENFDKGIYNYQDNIFEKFIEENENDLEKVIECKISIDDFDCINKLDFLSLQTAFRLIPINTHSEVHKHIALSIISIFANSMLSDEDDEKIDYMVRHSFFERYSYFVLSQSQNEVYSYLQPFLEQFNKSEHMADLFKAFVVAEDNLNTYNNFWFIWNSFKEKIFEACKNGDGIWYTDKIVRSYLFAEIIWKDTAKDWHTFKENDKRFFREISENIGHCPSCLYSISKLLNDIGTPYIDDGVTWIALILNDKDYINKKLETNTIYYIEHYIKRYIYKNRENIKVTKVLKNKVLTILNFLIEKGSVVGYMLRENIV